MGSASGDAHGLPGFPVAEGNFLAYSCAAARDLHPLPSLRRAAKTRVPNELTKSKNNRPRNLTPQDEEVNRGAAAALFSETSQHVENEREEDAHNDRSRQRKIKGGVLATVNKISGQSPQRQVRPSEQHQHNAGDQQEESEANQDFAQFRHNTYHT